MRKYPTERNEASAGSLLFAIKNHSRIKNIANKMDIIKLIITYCNFLRVRNSVYITITKSNKDKANEIHQGCLVISSPLVITTFDAIGAKFTPIQIKYSKHVKTAILFGL